MTNTEQDAFEKGRQAASDSLFPVFDRIDEQLRKGASIRCRSDGAVVLENRAGKLLCLGRTARDLMKAIIFSDL